MGNQSERIGQGVVTSLMPRETREGNGSGDTGRVGVGGKDLFSLSSFPPLPARKPEGKGAIEVVQVVWPLGVQIRMGRVDGQMESIWHNPICQHLAATSVLGFYCCCNQLPHIL